jgi:hypothetical protein
MLSPNWQRLAPFLLAAGLLCASGCGSQPAPSQAQGQNPTTERKPDVKDVVLTGELLVPYILWGGDVATFLANGGETTQAGSIFDKHGLKLKLVRQDNFNTDQVRDYKEGKSPFLRGTLSMLGQVSEDIGGDGRTVPVVFLQLTWSAGDHLVARSQLHRINDLPGKKIALQKGGPHVGMLNDILFTARLGWKDINVVWTEDVTGDKGPAELFRKDPSIDACFAITPDMAALTGGFDKTGDGKDATVAGAHVLVSTQDMKRSIADVYACRKDFYDAHRDVVEKFAAGYLKATEEVVAVKKAGAAGERYKSLLKLARDRFTDLKSDDEADGLIADAVFVGLPGNYAFFKDTGNLSGFDAKHKAALDLARDLGDAKVRLEMLSADFDYAKLKALGELTATVNPPQVERFVESPHEKSTLYSFNVHFDGGQSTFPEAQYGKDFQRTVEQASLFGNAVISMKGHANPQELTWAFRRLAVQRGLLTERQGKFFRKDGSEFEMNDMKQILAMIDKEDLGGVQIQVGGERALEMKGINEILQLLRTLSDQRAESVRRSVLDYAKKHNYRLDASQIKFGGLGGTEPVVTFPKEGDIQAGRVNRRVEVRIIQVGVEAIKPEDFER